jgi:anti-repressor protein
MSTDLTTFDLLEFGSLRVHIDANNEPWFCAKDVIGALKYNPESKVGMICYHVPEQWKGVNPIYTLGGPQQMLTLSEQGLYFFLGRSDKPKALSYQMKVAGEIMPAIRKHGGYLTPAKIEEVLLNPDTIIRLATELKDERAKAAAQAELIEKQAAKIEADKPKALFAEAVTASKTSILVGEMATILKQNGVDVGGTRLFRTLRDEGYLIKLGDRRNLPTQKSMDLGLMEIKERIVVNPDGTNRLTRTPKITGKGQVYFSNLFLSRSAEQARAERVAPPLRVVSTGLSLGVTE